MTCQIQGGGNLCEQAKGQQWGLIITLLSMFHFFLNDLKQKHKPIISANCNQHVPQCLVYFSLTFLNYFIINNLKLIKEKKIQSLGALK